MAANPLFITFRVKTSALKLHEFGRKSILRAASKSAASCILEQNMPRRKILGRGCAYPAPCTNLPLPNLHTAPLHRPHHSPTLSPILVYARPRALRNFPQCSKSPSYMLFLIVMIWTEPKGIATGMINHAPSWYVTKNFHEQMTSFFIFSFSNFSQID